MALDTVASCIKYTAAVAKEIKERFEQLASNNAYCYRILRNVEELEKLSSELQNLEDSAVSDVVQENLVKVNESLSIITTICKSMSDQNKFLRLLDPQSEEMELIQIDANLCQAHDRLQTALQLATLNEAKQIRDDVKTKTHELKNTVLHPEAGIFINPGQSRRPRAVQNVKVSLIPKGDFVAIGWTDGENDFKKLVRYEIQFDDETKRNIPIPVSSLSRWNCEHTTLLGEPILLPGRIYAIKMRAVSGGGPSDWSSIETFRFSSGPPAKPKKPKVFPTSPTEVKVEVQRLSEDEERGSPVTHCEIRYIEIEKSNEIACDSKCLKKPLKGRNSSTTITVGSLKQNTKYQFCVKMINSAGIGDASEGTIVNTECFVPGSPQNVRISSKRTSSTLKVRWDSPTRNYSGVKNYVVQHRRFKKTEWDASTMLDNTKHSFKVVNLKTNTKYEFRVQALNQKNEGNSSTVLGETRIGAVGRGMASVAAFAGGTAGGPIIGSIGFGTMSAVAVLDKPKSGSGESGSGKKAAAAAAATGGAVGGFLLGLVGAPFMGIGTAIVTNERMKGDWGSPQTSDDESQTSDDQSF